MICAALACVGTARTAMAAAPDGCAAYGTLKFVCGPEAAEDLLRIGDSPWLIASGLAEGGASGHLRLVNTRDKCWANVYPASDAIAAPDAVRFPNCHTPPDAAKFSAHGIALRPLGAGRQELLVVNHGGREAIEFFELRTGSGKPSIAVEGMRADSGGRLRQLRRRAARWWLHRIAFLFTRPRVASIPCSHARSLAACLNGIRARRSRPFPAPSCRAPMALPFPTMRRCCTWPHGEHANWCASSVMAIRSPGGSCP